MSYSKADQLGRGRRAKRREPVVDHLAELRGMTSRDKEQLSLLLDVMTTDPAKMTPGQLRKAREYAELTLFQAAKRLGVPTALLMEVEAGRETMGAAARAAMYAAMREVYGVKEQVRPRMPWE